jgi:flagellin-like protein
MVSLFNNKRGVSPLIATILLIAFAVALGAVVMSIGRSTIGGMDAGFAILDLGGKKQVCFFDRQADSALEITIKNGDTMEIADFQISIIGSVDVLNSNSLLSTPLNKGEVKRLLIKYDESAVGEIRKVIITPNIIRNGERTLGTGINLENIVAC